MPDSVYWIDRSLSRSRMRITLSAAPIDVGPILREHLFAQMPTVVMTSATLATGGSEAVVRVLPVADWRVPHSGNARLGSPFDYRRRRS